MTCFFAGIKSSATKIGLDLDPWCTSFFPSCLNDAMWISAWQPKQTFPFHLVHWCFPLQQACPTPQSQCFNIFGLSSNSNNFCWLDWHCFHFRLEVVFCDSHIWLRRDWWNGYRLGCFQLFLQLGDMFITDCFLQVLWSHTCDLYPNPSLLVWAPLSWHATCQSSTAYRQLDNNQVNYSESQKSVLRQETVCTSCWLWGNAPNVIVILVVLGWVATIWSCWVLASPTPQNIFPS